MSPVDAPAPTVDFRGDTTSLKDLIGGIWQRRTLVRSLARANFHRRYRSTSLGLAWVAILPLLQGAMLVVIFTRVIPLGSGAGFTAYVMSGTVVWNFFSTSLSTAATSIVDTAGIATRVYFPRLILPGLAPTGNIPGFACGLVVVTTLLLVLGVAPGPQIVLLVPVIVLSVLLSWLFGALATVAHVYFRDTKYLVQAVTMLWFYITPVFYPIEQADRIRWVIDANPVTGLLDITRLALLGEADHLRAGLVSLSAWIAALTIVTLAVYRRTDRVAVDRL